MMKSCLPFVIVTVIALMLLGCLLYMSFYGSRNYILSHGGVVTFERWAGLASEAYVSWENADITDSELIHIAQLGVEVASVELTGNKRITDIGMLTLSKLGEGLQYLDVTGTSVTRKGLSIIHQNCRNCSVRHGIGEVEPPAQRLNTGEF